MYFESYRNVAQKSLAKVLELYADVKLPMRFQISTRETQAYVLRLHAVQPDLRPCCSAGRLKSSKGSEQNQQTLNFLKGQNQSQWWTLVRVLSPLATGSRVTVVTAFHIWMTFFRLNGVAFAEKLSSHALLVVY